MDFPFSGRLPSKANLLPCYWKLVEWDCYVAFSCSSINISGVRGGDPSLSRQTRRIWPLISFYSIPGSETHRETYIVDFIRKSVLYRDDISAEGTDWQEIEANYFAACLLMPEHLIVAEANNRKELDEEHKAYELRLCVEVRS